MKIFRYLKIALFAVVTVFAAACTAVPRTQPVNTGNLPLTENAVSQLDALINQITVDDLIHSHKLEHFRREGIEVLLKNIRKTDNDNIKFTVLLKKGLKKLEISVDAILQYRYFRTGDKIIDIDVYWGNLSIGNGEIVFTSLDSIQLWSADDFEPIEKEFDFSFMPGSQQYLADVIRDRKGYTIAYYAAGEQGIAVMDRQGCFEKKYILRQRSPYIYFGEKTEEDEFNQNFRLTVKNYMFYMDRRQKTLAIINKDTEVRDGYIYDMENDTLYRCDMMFYCVDDNTSCLLLSRSGISAYPENKDVSDFVAVRAENHSPKSFFVFEGDEIDPAFGYDEKMGRRDLLTFSSEGKLHVVRAYCPETKQTLELDFANKKADFFYLQGAENLLKIAESADGVYSIVKNEGYGEAGTVLYSVFLRENATGRIKYLCETGGAYGGGVQAGFYENNDAWLISYDSLLVFSSDMSEEKPVFSFSGRTGFNMEEEGRKDLLYAIRNPITKVYTIVYRHNKNGKEEYVSQDSFQLKDTYRIAHISSDGNVLADFDTGENVVFTPMGYEKVKLYIEDKDKLVMYVYLEVLDAETFDYTENVVVSGWMNIADGRYTVIQPFSWPSV